MDKEQVAAILVDIGTLLELKGENPFKTRAYVNAARTLEGLTEPLANIVAEERLGEIKGIGDALQQKITELVTTGKLKYYDELKASVPPGLVDMLGIPGVGPKKVKALYDKLEKVVNTFCPGLAKQPLHIDRFGGGHHHGYHHHH